MPLTRIVAALAELRKALASAGAPHPFEIVIAPEDEAALREFFSQTDLTADVITKQVEIVFRVRSKQ